MDSINRNSIFSRFNIKLHFVLYHPKENFRKLKNNSFIICIALLSVSSSTPTNVLAIVSMIYMHEFISKESHMELTSRFKEMGRRIYNHPKEK